MEEITKLKISMACIIIFALIAIFFIGYQYAYTKAVNYANGECVRIKYEESKMRPTLNISINISEGINYG